MMATLYRAVASRPMQMTSAALSRNVASQT